MINLLQVDFVLLLSTATVFIGMFPPIIENARKQSREAHLADLRRVTEKSDVGNVVDWIEGYFSYQHVVFLRVSQALLFGFLLCSLWLLVAGYYLSSAVIEDVRRVSDHLPQGCSSITVLDGIYLRVPAIHFGLSTLIEVIVLVSLIVIATANQFWRHLKDIINPPRYGG